MLKTKTIREIIDGTIDACPPEMKTSSFKLYVNQEAYLALGCSEGEEPTIYRNFFVICENMPVNVICNIRDVPETNKIEALYNEEENKLAELKEVQEVFEPYSDKWVKEISKLRKNLIVKMFQSVGKEREALKEVIQTYKNVSEAQQAFIDHLTEKKELVEFLAVDKFIENLKEPLTALRVNVSSLDDNGLDQAGKIIDCILKNRPENGN